MDPGLMQMLAQMSSGGGAPPSAPPMVGMIPGMPPMEGGEGNPLIAMLMQMLMGQGGGQGMPPGPPTGGMPMAGGGY